MLNGAQRNAVEWSGVKHLTLVKRRFFASARPSLRSGPAPAQNDGVFAQVTQKVGMHPFNRPCAGVLDVSGFLRYTGYNRN